MASFETTASCCSVVLSAELLLTKNGRDCRHLQADYGEWSHLAAKTLPDDGPSCDA